MKIIGVKVAHKRYGDGFITAVDASAFIFEVEFLAKCEKKRFGLQKSALECFAFEHSSAKEGLISYIMQQQPDTKTSSDALTSAMSPESANVQIDENRQYWRYRAGNVERTAPFSPEELNLNWHKDIKDGVMQQKLKGVGDLSQYKSKEELVAMRNNNSGRARNAWALYDEMRIGDVVFSIGTDKQVLGVGIVDGDYVYDEKDSTRYHKRKVKWFVETNLAHHGLQQGSLSKFNLKNAAARTSLEKLLGIYGKLIDKQY